MDTEEILEGLRTKIKGSETKENIEERGEEIRKRLEKEVKKGRYAELKEIGADLKDVAHILAYTENEASFVKKVIKEQRKFKNDPTNFGKRLEKTRMKILFLKRSGKYEYYHKLPVEERMKELKKLRKYPEWYLDRAILDLGSYFEAISSPDVKQAEERRQYQLIADLLDDFGLFKQFFNKAWDEDDQDWDEAKRKEHARERVVKRAEVIPAKVWKERIQEEKERLEKFFPSPSSKTNSNSPF